MERGIQVDCRFLDTLTDAVLIISKKTGRILYASKAVEEVLGTSKHRITSETFSEVFGVPPSEGKTVIKVGRRRVRVSSFDAGEFFITVLSFVGFDSDFEVFEDMVAVSRKMKEIFELVRTLAPFPSPVLVTGETGTGKELVTRALHKLSGRKGPLVKINCAALPKDLLESELFGYEKGAFTGAFQSKPGKFEIAHEGTLYLDEIGDMPYELQAKLLRVIETGEVERLGSNKVRKVNVRIIASTNRNLEKMVKEGKFRADLYFRISVFKIDLPPLRERREDIIPLAEWFLQKLSQKYGLGQKVLSERARKLLVRWEFPGNVRELENLLERAYVMSKGTVLDDKIIIEHIRTLAGDEFEFDETDEHCSIPDEQADENKSAPLPTTLKYEDIEKQKIYEALRKAKNIKEAAEILGMHRTTLWRKMKKYGIK